MGWNPLGAGDVYEPLRVRRVGRADDEQQVHVPQQLLHGPLAVRGRVADVLAGRPLDAGEAAPEHRDDLARLVDREGCLGDVSERTVRWQRDALRVLRGLDEYDRLGRFAQRSLDLLVPRVADEDERVAG